MYKSFEIRNFRGFSNLQIPLLDRINLIAGKNNTGKTSLLEAVFLFLGPGNPDHSVRVNKFRGLEFLRFEPEDIWGQLFFDGRIEEPIVLTAVDENNESSALKLELAVARDIEIGISEAGVSEAMRSMPASFGARELVMTYESPGGVKSTVKSHVTTDGRIIATVPGFRGERPEAFLPARTRFLGTDAERFSKLDRLKRADDLLPIMKTIEPRLKRLSVLVKGGVPLIHGDIGLRELVPLPLMGEGLVRLLSILLAIVDSAYGTVLIDEIENGIHHTALGNTWKAIAFAARQSNTQVFATTHSWECLVAAHETISATPEYDLLVHRLDLVDGVVRVSTYDKKKLPTAIAAGLEVR